MISSLRSKLRSTSISALAKHKSCENYPLDPVMCSLILLWGQTDGHHVKNVMTTQSGGALWIEVL